MSSEALKIAVSGKGGVGKTTISSMIARLFAAAGRRVYAIDADPVANLAAALGIPEDPPLTPIAELSDLIAERTGTTKGTYGGFFRMNPRVDDLPERFSRERDGVKLLVAGTLNEGGSGCFCPESAVLRALVQHLVLYRDEVVVLDMEAGIEHIGRATARGVDYLLVVVDPGARSAAAARRIRDLAADIGVGRIAAVVNRVQSPEDEAAARKALAGIEILAFLPFDERVIAADRRGERPYEDLAEAPAGFRDLVAKLTP